MDIGKAFGASKTAVIFIFFVAIVRSLLLLLLSVIPQTDTLFWGAVACMIVPAILVVDILLYLWLGQLIYKAKLGILDAVVVGGLAGAVDGIIGGVMLMVASLFGISVSTGGVGMDSLTTAMYGLQLSFIAAVLITIILFFIGLTLSAIGYMVGGVKRK